MQQEGQSAKRARADPNRCKEQREEEGKEDPPPPPSMQVEAGGVQEDLEESANGGTKPESAKSLCGDHKSSMKVQEDDARMQMSGDSEMVSMVSEDQPGLIHQKRRKYISFFTKIMSSNYDSSKN